MIDQRDYFALANDPRVRPVLDAIAMAEGTTEHGYNTMFGGGRIDDLSDHPRKKLPFTQTDGKRNYSSAAGKYQFLEGTWDDAANQLGLSDFSPANQDAAAVFLIDRANALDSILNGDVDAAIDKLGAVWASLPTSPYPQPKMNDQQFDTMLAQAYGEPMLPMSSSAYSTTETKPTEQKMQTISLPNTIARIAALQDTVSGLMKEPEITPEFAELMSQKAKQDRSMLPLAVGALLSGDKQMQQLGASMYQMGQEGRKPVKIGDDAVVNTATGEIIENPFGDVNRANAALPLSAEIFQNQQANEINRFKAQAQAKLAAEKERMNAFLGIGRLDQQTRANDIREADLLTDPNYILNSGINPNTQNSSVFANQNPQNLNGQKQQKEKEIPPENAISDIGIKSYDGAKLIGYTHTGKPLWEADGNFLMQGSKGSKYPIADPGPYTDIDAWHEGTEALRKRLAKMNKIKRIVSNVVENPEGFGFKNNILSLFESPGLQSFLINNNLPPEQARARGRVLKEAAQMVHEIYGASVVGREAAKAAGWNFDGTNTPETVVAMLANLPSALEDLSIEYTPAMLQWAAKQANIDPNDLVFKNLDDALGKGSSDQLNDEDANQLDAIDKRIKSILNGN